MKLTNRMKKISRNWLGDLVNLTVCGVIPTVPNNYETGLFLGVSEAIELLKKAETTEEWKEEIVNAISRRKTFLGADVVRDQKVINKAWIMGLNTVLAYAESIELYDGIDCY